jgi:pilus assembly protein Flp/PilA
MRSRLTTCAARFLKDEGGPAAAEYAVMLALILAVCLAAVSLLGGKFTNNAFTYVGYRVGNAGS